jgi:hypothetical protein
MLQPEYDYDLFTHSGASSLFPNEDSGYDRVNSAPPIQGLQQRPRDMKIPSDLQQQQQQSMYDPGQSWNLWKNGGTDNGKT